MANHKEILFPCRYTEGIECQKQQDCDRCGWNPTVKKQRVHRIRSQPVETFGIFKKGRTRR